MSARSLIGAVGADSAPLTVIDPPGRAAHVMVEVTCEGLAVRLYAHIWTGAE